ncbi:hypothetical protein DFJ74DRAFT_700571 [Hyaloraphidium curvatum]|nr:hypothetical protein DFJ74DRAFT_700571 [Hyaloraphidium curvatum]
MEERPDCPARAPHLPLSMPPPRFLRLESVVRLPRHSALSLAAAAVSDAGGWVSSHALFSDVRATVGFRLPASKTGDFGRRLAEAGIRTEPEVPATMASAPAGDNEGGGQSEGADEEVWGLLGMTFPEGTGDLKHKISSIGD